MSDYQIIPKLGGDVKYEMEGQMAAESETKPEAPARPLRPSALTDHGQQCSSEVFHSARRRRARIRAPNSIGDDGQRT
jgi:hypothetical protein